MTQKPDRFAPAPRKFVVRRVRGVVTFLLVATLAVMQQGRRREQPRLRAVVGWAGERLRSARSAALL